MCYALNNWTSAGGSRVLTWVFEKLGEASKNGPLHEHGTFPSNSKIPEHIEFFMKSSKIE